MLINNQQQNSTFQRNIIVSFPAGTAGSLRDLAKKFAVTKNEINSMENVGLAALIDTCHVLVLDKTVEESRYVMKAFYRHYDVRAEIAALKNSGDFQWLSEEEQAIFEARRHWADLNYNNVLTYFATPKKAKTIEYTA